MKPPPGSTPGHFYRNLPLMTKDKSSKKLKLQKPAERLISIFRIMRLHGEITPRTCRLVADKLNRYNPRKNHPWSHSYIRNIYNGKQEPSKYIAPAINKLHKRLVSKPKKKRYRMITEALSKEQYDSWPKSMAERREALDNMRKD